MIADHSVNNSPSYQVVIREDINLSPAHSKGDLQIEQIGPMTPHLKYWKFCQVQISGFELFCEM